MGAFAYVKGIGIHLRLVIEENNMFIYYFKYLHIYR